MNEFNKEINVTYDDIKDLVVFRMAGVKRQQDMNNLLHTKMDNGFSLIYVIEMDKKNSLLVTEKILEALGCTEEQIFNDAKRNTERLYPPLLKSVENAILDSMTSHGKGKNLLYDTAVDNSGINKNQMFVLTNCRASYGSTVIFYDGVLEAVGDFFNEDFYMIPSSIHEFILLPKGAKVKKDDLNFILNDVNKGFVKEQEILGDKVLFYKRKTGNIL